MPVAEEGTGACEFFANSERAKHERYLCFLYVQLSKLSVQIKISIPLTIEGEFFIRYSSSQANVKAGL